MRSPATQRATAAAIVSTAYSDNTHTRRMHARTAGMGQVPKIDSDAITASILQFSMNAFKSPTSTLSISSCASSSDGNKGIDTPGYKHRRRERVTKAKVHKPCIPNALPQLHVAAYLQNQRLRPLTGATGASRAYSVLAMPIDSVAPELVPFRSRFEVLEVLGSGTFGVVSKAKDARRINSKHPDGPIVAVKEYCNGTNGTAELVSCLQEWTMSQHALTGAANHPHMHFIAEYHELLIYPGVCALSMRCYMTTLDKAVGHLFARSKMSSSVSAGSTAHLFSPKTSTWKRVWMGQLTHAVAYLHSIGIMHCDIKPNNVLVAADGTLRLTDFNSARFIARASPAHKYRLCLPYAPPEHMWECDLSPAGDVWALGCILLHFNGERFYRPAEEYGAEPLPGNKDAANAEEDSDIEWQSTVACYYRQLQGLLNVDVYRKYLFDKMHDEDANMNRKACEWIATAMELQCSIRAPAEQLLSMSYVSPFQPGDD